MKILLVLLLVACGAGQRPRPTLGAITGLVRDKATVEPLAQAELEVAGRTTTSDRAGIYLFDNLPPGRYTLRAKYAGQPITINNIEVVRGQASYVDVSFTLGEPAEAVIEWGDVAREAEITTFTATVPRIEGTVADANTRARVAGAVVTASRGPEFDTLQTISDDHGRYRFDGVMPGTYAISAYYSIAGRGQIEVRRAEVHVENGFGVFVPLWIELKQ